MDAVADDTAASRTCPECGRVFTKAGHLPRHLLTHDQQKPFSCSVCRKTFAREDALQRHMRTVHNTAKRRRTEEDRDSSHDQERSNSRPAVEPAAHDSTPEPLALLRPSVMFADQSADVPSVSNVSPHSTEPPAPLDDPVSYAHLPPQNLFANAPILTAFGDAGAAPSSQLLDDMIAGWLRQDGAALATETALAAAFSEQSHMDQIAATMGANTFYSQHSATHFALDDFEQPGSRQQQFIEGFGTLSSNTPGRSPARAPASARVRQVMTADTWESGMSNAQHPPSGAASRPGSPAPREITSPEDVVAELHINHPITPQAPERVIPSMKFLEACLYLYFRDFHPSFPVIHRGTFERDRTPPLLLLSMCSIGCMFVGTQAARDSGVWIYERLHHIIVVTRDAKMATEESRIAVMLSALLGQCFSFLYGQPKQMLTAESFHGSLCTKARRSGLSMQVRRNPITYDQLLDLDPGMLRKRWRQWAHQETLRRLALALSVHAAEATIYGGLARLTIVQVSSTDVGFSDALFEANDAETWRLMLQHSEHGVRPPSDTPESFLPTVLLAQTIVNIRKMRELDGTPFASSQLPLPEFYTYMLSLAKDHGTLAVLERPRRMDIPPHLRALTALWHYTCIIRLAQMGLIQKAAGRGGHPDSETVKEIRAWVNTPAARLATLHAGHVLYHAADLDDRAFLVPRAIFQATLLLLCYLYFSPAHGEADIVDLIDVSEWSHLGQMCHILEGGDLGAATFPHEDSPADIFLAQGMRSIHVRGFFDGKEKMLDIVSLRSRSNRLLRRCTPWGIGDTLGEILSQVWF